MKETKLDITHTCHLELCEWESFPTKLTLEYVEHATDHWSSDTETSVDITVEQAKEIIAILQKYVGAAHTADRAAGGVSKIKHDYCGDLGCLSCRPAYVKGS